MYSISHRLNFYGNEALGGNGDVRRQLEPMLKEGVGVSMTLKTTRATIKTHSGRHRLQEEKKGGSHFVARSL